MIPGIQTWNRNFRLPEHILQPGDSYVIATVYDFGPEQYALGLDGYPERATKVQIPELADIQFHVPEPNGYYPADSVIGEYHWTMETSNGRGCFYLEEHLSENTSVVIDQVGGVFDINGRNSTEGYYDVAGVTGATGNSILVRKFDIKKGNLDFANARGVGLDDSEWMPVPIIGAGWRDAFWTLGNHGDYNLDENTLQSDIADVDFANKIITVPWGTRNGDGIMELFTKTPGIAWKYICNSSAEDSLFMSARTGDQIVIYVCGNDLDFATFDIFVNEPTSDDNIVVSKYIPTFEANWPNVIEIGQIYWPRVTNNISGVDTITGSKFGLPFALRVDSLFKYLEKASNATWEIVWVDATPRSDLKDGDKLKVVSENGSVKEYFIQI